MDAAIAHFENAEVRLGDPDRDEVAVIVTQIQLSEGIGADTAACVNAQRVIAYTKDADVACRVLIRCWGTDPANELTLWLARRVIEEALCLC